MSLTAKQRSYLRALAHHRRVVVSVGNAGVTEPVLAELEQAIARHELLKVRLPGIHRDERATMVEKIATELGADAVQTIGRIGVFYRRGEKPKIDVPVS